MSTIAQLLGAATVTATRTFAQGGTVKATRVKHFPLERTVIAGVYVATPRHDNPSQDPAGCPCWLHNTPALASAPHAG